MFFKRWTRVIEILLQILSISIRQKRKKRGVQEDKPQNWVYFCSMRATKIVTPEIKLLGSEGVFVYGRSRL